MDIFPKQQFRSVKFLVELDQVYCPKPDMIVFLSESFIHFCPKHRQYLQRCRICFCRDGETSEAALGFCDFVTC